MTSWKLLLAVAALTLLPSSRAHAFTYEFIFAGNAEKQTGENLDYGFSTRMRFTTYKDDAFQFGGHLFANFPGMNPTIVDAILGAGLRTKGSFYGDFGGGIRYHTLFGMTIAAWVGAGIDISKSWFISLPIIYRHNWSIEWAPYIGFRF